MLRSIRISLALAVVALLAGGATARAAPTPAPAAPAAAANGVRVTRAYGWYPMGPGKLIVWLGVEEPYLVELAPPCDAAPPPAVTGITAHNRHLAPHRDEVLWNGGRCAIRAIHRASPAALRTQGVGRERASALALINVVPKKKAR